MGINIEELFIRARELQQNNQLSAAINHYEQLLSLVPDHTDALRFLSLAYVQLDDMDSAIVFLKRALKFHPKDASLHNNLGNAYKKIHSFDEAKKQYNQALELNPNYAEAHNNLASVYAEEDNYQKALNHYRLALHIHPDFTLVHYNLGLLLLKNNQLAAAKKQFKNVITLFPEHCDAHFYIGLIELETKELERAEEAFQEVLAINKEHVQALTNLGVIALKREEGQLAVDYFTKALTFDNHHIEARNNLAATFMHHDLFENALMHYDVLLKVDPENSEYLYNSGVAQMALGHLEEAIYLFEEILIQKEDHFASLNNLAAIYIRLNQREKARTFLTRALQAKPCDEATQFMLSALNGPNKETGPCAEYVNNLFNNYARYYDQHMQGQLHYTVPQHLEHILKELHFPKMHHAVDLGCGTGLCGVVLRDRCNYLIGVDIASKMLAQAKNKGIYDALIEDELINFLKKKKELYDLILAADVFPYLGELDTLFAALSPRLKNKGIFIFTHEISENKTWELQESARFSHHPEYIKTLCEQYEFKIIYQEKIIARQQNQNDLAVMIHIVTPNSARFEPLGEPSKPK